MQFAMSASELFFAHSSALKRTGTFASFISTDFTMCCFDFFPEINQGVNNYFETKKR